MGTCFFSKKKQSSKLLGEKRETGEAGVGKGVKK